jgi:hypothetical protein
MPPDARLATALLPCIKTDTDDLFRARLPEATGDSSASREELIP